MQLATITIDKAKCRTPMACRICIQGCPMSIFEVRPYKLERGKEINVNEPDMYNLKATYYDRCTGCGWCVEKCPVEAISIEF